MTDLIASGEAAPSWNTVSDWLTEIARQLV
jgi:hypothetical protein